ncbi:SRPBCC domain-containing protein [Pseudoxanthomonas sp. J35]|uniref:SRPBCC family protein n=1 Tax=Pseudoxanthomonas sp. J35 TaxID=935852 RepID=UPI0004AF255A|nr:SRPBCC domain-containing protein [Pseudoxanthomonas sp. J35]
MDFRINAGLTKAAVLLAVLLAWAAPAAAAVKEAGPAGFTVEHSRTVAVAPDVAWQGLVGGVDRWWSKDHNWWGSESTLSIEPRAGGCFCERTGDGREAMHLQVGFVDAPRTLRMVGALGPLQGMGLHGVMEWHLAPEDQGTRITVIYRAGGYTPGGLEAIAPAVDGVIGLQLGRLADYLSAP